MRLLVTGGAGFIGSHVAAAALAQGRTVAILDDLSTGRRENIPNGCAFYDADVTNSGDVRKVFRHFKPTVVSHHAAQATVAASVRAPLRDAAVNVLGTLNVASLTAAVGAERLVMAASGGTAYGVVRRIPSLAGRTATHPISPYGCSKLAGEHYVRAFAGAHDFRFAILRYANVYGPRQDPNSEGGVVATFISRLLRGQMIEVNGRASAGDEGCVRDYIFVDDVTRANLAAIDGAFDGETVDVGTGAGTSTRELARLVATVVRRRSEIRFAPPRAGDLPASILCPRRLIEEIGALTPLRRGLAQTVKWFAEIPSPIVEGRTRPA